MAPKTAAKKAKNAAVATSSKRSPDKLRAKVAAAATEHADAQVNPADALTDAELEAKNTERGWFGLPPLVRTPGVAPPDAGSPEATADSKGVVTTVGVPPAGPAAEPAAAPAAEAAAPAAEAAAPAAEPGPLAPAASVRVDGVTAAGSALSAKRVLDHVASPASAADGPPVAAMPPSTSPSESQDAPTDSALLEALKTARKEMASKEKVMTNAIVTTEALEQLVRLKVVTLAALAEIPGFGVTRAARYGEPLLLCVRQHVDALRAGKSELPISCHDRACDRASAQGSICGASNVGPVPSSATHSPAAGSEPSESATILYSHYRQRFPLSGSGTELDFAHIDSKYMLSHVFKGAFSCRLQPQVTGDDNAGATAPIRPDGGRLRHVEAADGGGRRQVTGRFSGLRAGAEYILYVEEDPKQATGAVKAPGGRGAAAKAAGEGSSGFGRSIGGRSQGTALVTQELKKLTPDELREGGAKYRALLEQRDLEDVMADNAILGEDSSGCSCVWGNPCAAPHACMDWKNRFEVAKRNGWKGF